VNAVTASLNTMNFSVKNKTQTYSMYQIKKYCSK